MVLILYFIFCICADIAISRRQLSGTKATAFERRWIETFMGFDEGHGRCVDHNKLWKILKEIGMADHLTCLMRKCLTYIWVKKQQLKPDMEQQAGSKLGKEYVKTVILSPCLYKWSAEYVMQNAGLDESQAGVKIAGRNMIPL